jgi:ring-1,2-phenylacetyl-CoA epoxidase subunit PaaC
VTGPHDVSGDNAYEALNDGTDDPRWAYGTGFSDPLVGIGTAPPAGVDGDELAAYCLMLGDDALVMSHRLQEWVGRAPELEEETALANIALDLLGQARPLLTRAGQADGTGRDEDAYAFHRSVGEFRNVRLAEVVDADFAALTARLLIFSTWRLELLHRLVDSRDPALSAVAAKGVKEVTYHRDYAAQWVVRLGDGTALSRARLVAGLVAVDPLVAELFVPCHVEVSLAAAGVAVDPCGLRPAVELVMDEVLAAATVSWRLPAARGGLVLGRRGRHTEAMGQLLDEMQSVARAHPGATW